MRAFTVSVNYADLASLTLPRMRRHFSEYWVVTDKEDSPDAEVGRRHDCRVFATDLFFQGGADFNKWAALEACLDVAGRGGWICLLDADVIWPTDMKFVEKIDENSHQVLDVLSAKYGDTSVQVGQLFSPLRKMMYDVSRPVPPEEDWNMLPTHRNINEWAGFTQIFHGSDQVLVRTPWHDTCYRHAGISDSFFQFRWANENKVRPPWQCLHLGGAGENWLGRAGKRTDGTIPDGAQDKLNRIQALWNTRREREAAKRAGTLVGDVFDAEKVKDMTSKPG